MTICLAYAPTEPGRAALRHCVAEARATGCDVLVVNAARDWHDTPAELDDDAVREVEEQLDGAGVTWRWHEGPHGLSGADEILTAVEEVDVTLVVIGVTHRSHVLKRIIYSYYKGESGKTLVNNGILVNRPDPSSPRQRIQRQLEVQTTLHVSNAMA